MKAFKAYDIRGEWGTDLNADIAYRIGYFLPDVLDTDTYLVGRDMRLSSDTLFEALTRGLTDRGKNVDSIGLATTPLVHRRIPELFLPLLHQRAPHPVRGAGRLPSAAEE